MPAPFFSRAGLSDAAYIVFVCAPSLDSAVVTKQTDERQQNFFNSVCQPLVVRMCAQSWCNPACHILSSAWCKNRVQSWKQALHAATVCVCFVWALMADPCYRPATVMRGLSSRSNIYALERSSIRSSPSASAPWRAFVRYVLVVVAPNRLNCSWRAISLLASIVVSKGSEALNVHLLYVHTQQAVHIECVYTDELHRSTGLQRWATVHQTRLEWYCPGHEVLTVPELISTILPFMPCGTVHTLCRLGWTKRPLPCVRLLIRQCTYCSLSARNLALHLSLFPASPLSPSTPLLSSLFFFPSYTDHSFPLLFPLPRPRYAG